MLRIAVILCVVIPLFVGCTRQTAPDTLVVHTIPTKPKRTVVIDPGHGGEDPGSQSSKYGYEEKALTLTTATLIATYLRDQGYHTIMTRSTDHFVPLKERAQMANLHKADLFVSMHYNYSVSKEADGVEVFFYDGQKSQTHSELRKLASQKLGKSVLACILKHTNAHSRGVKSGNYAVIRETTMPAILVEGGFLSNPEELKRLKDPKYIHFMAYAIARGIDAYFEQQ
jgi:N-acetylmuramoyl-L-alanine amidase